MKQSEGSETMSHLPLATRKDLAEVNVQLNVAVTSWLKKHGKVERETNGMGCMSTNAALLQSPHAQSPVASHVLRQSLCVQAIKPRLSSQQKQELAQVFKMMDGVLPGRSRRSFWGALHR
jgi:hypothetical protein